jgi:hypothetical protein
MRQRLILLILVVTSELVLLSSAGGAVKNVIMRRYDLSSLALCMVMLFLLALTGTACVQVGRDLRSATPAKVIEPSSRRSALPAGSLLTLIVWLLIVLGALLTALAAAAALWLAFRAGALAIALGTVETSLGTPA